MGVKEVEKKDVIGYKFVMSFPIQHIEVTISPEGPNNQKLVQFLSKYFSSQQKKREQV